MNPTTSPKDSFILIFKFKEGDAGKHKMLLVREKDGDPWDLLKITPSNSAELTKAMLEMVLGKFFKHIDVHSIERLDDSAWKDAENIFQNAILYKCHVSPESFALPGNRVWFVGNDNPAINLSREAFAAFSLPFVQSRLS